METTVEISYLPLMDNYQQLVDDFIGALQKNTKVTVEPGLMSSVLTGPYDEIMELLKQELKPFMENYPSVFSLRISNSCSACKTPE